MLIHHNVAGLDEPWGHGGGGINMEYSSPTIVNTEIYENVVSKICQSKSTQSNVKIYLSY